MIRLSRDSQQAQTAEYWPLLTAAKANSHGCARTRWSPFKKMLFHFSYYFLKKTFCCMIEKTCPNARYLQQKKSVLLAWFLCVMFSYCTKLFDWVWTPASVFSIATCFLHDIQQVVLPPQRLGLQPRKNFTLWKNEKLVRAGAAKATHLLPSDRRLTQRSVSMVWVRDIMTVIVWVPTLPADRGT